MHNRIASLAALLAVGALVSPGCAADDPGDDTNPASGGNGSGATGGGGGGDESGGSSGTAGSADGTEVCRQYATSGAISGDATGTYSCTFNESPAAYRCDYDAGEGASYQIVLSYPSALAFVEEAGVVGLQRFTVMSSSIGEAYRFSYDADGRLVSQVGVPDIEYSAWDTSGRPTAGMAQYDGCALPLAITYADGTRSRTTTFNILSGSGAKCGEAENWSNVDEWDEDGNSTVQRAFADSQNEVVMRYSVTASAEFCQER